MKLLFPTPSPPSWGEEVEYSQDDYMDFDKKQVNLDLRLNGHNDGSGPREILLPPLAIDDFKGLLNLSEMLSIFDFTWHQSEDYGMGRHIHYRPIPQDDEELYRQFLDEKMFKTQNNILILSLMPFLTPNTEIANNKIYVYFRESLEHWSFYVDHSSTNHYAYISINFPSDMIKPMTIEFLSIPFYGF